MEYLEHGDFSQYIQALGPLAEVEVREIATQLLEALAVLHSRNICHRDLKPHV